MREIFNKSHRIETPSGWVTVDARDDVALRASRDALSHGVIAAGLAVVAADTGRVLMLQRANTDGDPAAGMWEFPGGGIEGDESPIEAAIREWTEEVGHDLPRGKRVGLWNAANGKYTGYIYRIPKEEAVDIHQGDDRAVINPDDPDGDDIEVVAWFDPSHLPDNPSIRQELREDIPGIIPHLIGATSDMSHAMSASAPKVIWDASKHPRHGKGSGKGGQFAKKGDGDSGGNTERSIVRQEDGTYKEAKSESKLRQPYYGARLPENVKSDEFKKWFGDWESKSSPQQFGPISKVRDQYGQPMVVYHGTHHDFDEFHTKYANPENWWGKGIYFSNNLDDTGSNYFGKGPDIQNKINQEIDARENEWQYDQIDEIDPGELGKLHNPDIPDNEKEMIKEGMRKKFEGRKKHERELREQIEKKFMPHQGATVPAFLNMRRPFVVGDGHGVKETFLSYDLPMDDEEESGEKKVSQPSGDMYDIIESLRQNAPDYDSGRGIDDWIDQLESKAIDGEGMKASVLESELNNSFWSADKEEGSVFKNHRRELLRQAIEDAGFDGIIDNNVSKKFAFMPGMTSDTAHYIVFDPKQIKSAIGNSGAYSPDTAKLTMSATSFDPSEARDDHGRWTDDMKDVLHFENAPGDPGPWQSRMIQHKSGGELRYTVHKDGEKCSYGLNSIDVPDDKRRQGVASKMMSRFFETASGKQVTASARTKLGHHLEPLIRRLAEKHKSELRML